MTQADDRAPEPQRDTGQPPGEPAAGGDEPDLLADIAEEVDRRRRQGEGRDPRPPAGSEGAAGKIESGEW